MATSGRIFGLQWHVTNQCDQRCKHCYIWGEGRGTAPCVEEYTLDQCVSIVNKFIEFCESLGVVPRIALTGGDPLLFRWFWELLEYLHARNVRFLLLGNPFHLDEDVCRRLKRLGCRAYQMSLDGLAPIHDRIRKTGSFNETVKAIGLLRRNRVKTAIMSTVSRTNYQDIPELVKELVINHEVDVYDCARYCPAPTDVDMTLTPQEYRDFLSTMWEVYVGLAKTHKTLFPLKDHLWRLFLYERGLFSIRSENTVFQGCNCGISHLTLLPAGIVYACRRFESPIGNILTQSFAEIFLGETLGRYRQVKQLQGCRDCELLNYCRGCHAVSYGTFGSFFAKDPQCWKV